MVATLLLCCSPLRRESGREETWPEHFAVPKFDPFLCLVEEVSVNYGFGRCGGRNAQEVGGRRDLFEAFSLDEGVGARAHSPRRFSRSQVPSTKCWSGMTTCVSWG